MTVRTLTAATRLSRPLDEVFAFFAEARNLDALTPPWLSFRIVDPAPRVLERGALIDYALRIRGVPVRWRSEISTWDPPRRFVDRQMRGPYRLWEHEHRFEPEADGVRVVDVVRYEARGGPLEPLVHALLVKPDLRRIFRFRAERLADRFGACGALALEFTP